eukprot:scaffold271140_cov31-Tisochrysis_lutea.AAC.2
MPRECISSSTMRTIRAKHTSSEIVRRPAPQPPAEATAHVTASAGSSGWHASLSCPVALPTEADLRPANTGERSPFVPCNQSPPPSPTISSSATSASVPASNERAYECQLTMGPSTKEAPPATEPISSALSEPSASSSA